MTKRKFYMLVDCETGMNRELIDFAAVIYTRETGRGKTVLKPLHTLAVLVAENWGRVPLFHDKSSGEFGIQNLQRRERDYTQMVQDGRRTIASLAAVNKWLLEAITKYGDQLEITAYNWAFDRAIMQESGLIMPEKSFCLWHAAIGSVCDTRAYRQFILDNHLFGNRTKKTGHIGLLSNAEVVSWFITGNEIKEPHQALEDITGHEVKILERVLDAKKWREKITPFNYRECKLNKYFKVAK